MSASLNIAPANGGERKCHVCLPTAPPVIKGKSIFLAGSIDMGMAVNWQTAITSKLAHLPVTILNPRRDDWTWDWVQDISNTVFRDQVEWELDCQDRADVIAMYFDKNGKAPISLLELGLYAASGKMVVCCPEGFWRRGNVQIVCKKYGIKLVDTIDDLVECVVGKLGQVSEK
ncbi:hypothetical protein BDY21DRAFT_364449 [Lineolata rhizophorae]|uniref:Nucleoside 2-deoxyribosyltransferase domain-containing protein n=1 Tax=Lineolata rhizophorae TaxID=578093 RepID=A0A6A6NYW8_9PEZI|nr:hypothetical protein BDY21DRAFT_364449 [Lineolata rhizophorae]